jgi:polyphosphate kinase
MTESVLPISGTGPGVESAPPTAPRAPLPAIPSADATPLPDDRFLNREAGWLDFNARVLALAEDAELPLLERVKFAAIFASNLDEFFMVRVAGLKRRQATGLTVRSADGLTTREQLALIGDRSGQLQRRHAQVFADELRPGLAAEGITVTTWDQLGATEQQQLHRYFREQVFPVLTPLAVDPAHPFPYISGLSLNMAVVVRDPAASVEHFARVKVPEIMPRFVRIEEDAEVRGDATARFLPLEELIGAHLAQLFPGMEVLERHLFRVTRNADVDVEEDETEDLLQALEKELMRRRFGPAVRLEVAENITERTLDLLVRELEVHPRDVLRVPGLLDLTALWAIVSLDRPELKDEPYVPSLHPRLAGEDGMVVSDMFAVLREGDVVVHHPYDSFATSVQRFIEQAAADPNVLAIKQTLYRTSGDSPLVEALIDAAESGKQVVVLVEIKARFDEQNNITWARALERAGCHVVYGVVGLKTHCKTALVVRQEKGQLRRYAHVGTGNYNPKTARTYEDFGLLTADPAVGADLTDLFNALTGYSRQTDYRTLLVAPQRLRSGIIERIEAQAARARNGQPSYVRVKVNNLVDEQVLDALYRASRAGTPIDCVVRGICALRPGVPGLSETIRVRSVLGRYLEHSRVFSFGMGDDSEWLMGSADIMHRNLDRRVETLVRVQDRTATEQLASVFEFAMASSTRSWHLDHTGRWRREGSQDMQLLLAARMADRNA